MIDMKKEIDRIHLILTICQTIYIRMRRRIAINARYRYEKVIFGDNNWSIVCGVVWYGKAVICVNFASQTKQNKTKYKLHHFWYDLIHTINSNAKSFYFFILFRNDQSAKVQITVTFVATKPTDVAFHEQKCIGIL